MVGKHSVFAKGERDYDTGREDDLEQGTRGLPRTRTVHDDPDRGRHRNYNGSGDARPRPRIFKFRDMAFTALEDKRREDLKKALLHGIDRHAMEKFRVSGKELKAIKNKKVRAFYEDQNERLNDWLEVDSTVVAIADDVLESMDPDPDHDGDMERRGGLQEMDGNITTFLPEDVQQERARARRRARWAININVAANIALLAGKGVAVASTGSLSLVASFVDSALDLLCTLIIWTTNKLVSWRLGALKKRFPVGRRRLEPLGILVFSTIMVISFLQILKESVEKLAPLEGEPSRLSYTAIAAMVATIVIKGIIGLGCYPIKTTQVQALAQDCKTDVIFNTLSLLFPFIGMKANIWWLDVSTLPVCSPPECNLSPSPLM
ncbi:hypothetical protein BX600DRAFT_463061 [Xylariales sp. PMI_506]|nr:hypothetical protein BX600DRAFT_463061 [Xylariales sp. PMI_506]